MCVESSLFSEVFSCDFSHFEPLFGKFVLDARYNALLLLPDFEVPLQNS